MAVQRTRSIIRIKKGQRVILPSDAAIISITEVDGANATSLCDLPEPTPTRKVTYWFERRLDADPIFNENDRDVFVDSFYLGGNKVTFQNGLRQDSYLQGNTSFRDAMYAVPGVIKLYICSGGEAGSGRNNTITVEFPEDLEDPYFIFRFKPDSADNWFSRVYPIDPNQPGQVPRAECGTLIPRA